VGLANALAVAKGEPLVEAQRHARTLLAIDAQRRSDEAFGPSYDARPSL
jgi:hypothetical protein